MAEPRGAGGWVVRGLRRVWPAARFKHTQQSNSTTILEVDVDSAVGTK